MRPAISGEGKLNPTSRRNAEGRLEEELHRETRGGTGSEETYSSAGKYSRALLPRILSYAGYSVTFYAKIEGFCVLSRKRGSWAMQRKPRDASSTSRRLL